MENTLTLNQDWLSIGTYLQPEQYQEIIHHYYPSYYSYWMDNKIEKSLKLVQTLIEKKFIKEPKTVKNFIELVNAISEII